MGVKKNIFYTSILTTSNYIFPLIVYPYVSRVLGVTNIGLCNFIDNIINYFILFSMMGITIMGNRQIASERAKGHQINASFSSLFFINGLTTLLAILVLILLTVYNPILNENKEMMAYGALKVISNFFLIEWFYKGLEDFKFITIRTIIVKCLFIISVFIFVKNTNDYKIYYLLSVLMITGNSIINMIYSRHFARFNIRLIKLRNIIKPYFMLGVYMLLTSLCTTFNVVYLGFVTNDTQVGYYTTAIKLYSILLAFFTGVSSVLLPRMSNLIAQNLINEFKQMISKASSLLFAFSMPVIIISVIFAPQIIFLISGPGYEGAIIPMRIVMPLMLIIGYEQIAVIQCLMPLHKDKTIMLNSSAGAIMSILLNLILVHSLASIGSSIAWAVSETVILILSLIALRRLIKLRFPIADFIKSVVSYLPLIGILLIVYIYSNDSLYWLFLGIAGIITGIYTLIIQIYVLHNQELISLTTKLFKKNQMKPID